MLTLACVRAVFLSAPRELVCVGEFAWQPDVQMVSEEVWVQFALSGRLESLARLVRTGTGRACA